jgi:adenylate cyclase
MISRQSAGLTGALARAGASIKMFFLPEHGALRLAPFIVVAVATLGLGVLVSSLEVLQHLEWSLYDRYVQISSQTSQPAEGIVVVAIDEPSFQEMGLEWPWPRSLHGMLVNALHEAGARAIVFDIVFDSPSQRPEEDAEFARSIREAGDVILAADWQTTGDRAYSLVQWVEPAPSLAAAATAVGIARLIFDPDGKVRRAPLEFQGRPSLPLSVARLFSTFRAPADLGSSRLIHFCGPSRFGVRTVSYYQALDYAHMLPPGIFRDKIVLIGLSLGSSPIVKNAVDQFLTPYPEAVPGVEIHAATLDSLLRSAFIKEPFGNPLAVILLALTLGGVMAPVFFRRGAFFGLGITGVVMFGLVAAGYLLFDLFRIKIPVVIPAVMVGMMFLVPYLYRFLLGVIERRMILGAFKHYLAPAIVDKILKDPAQLRLGGANYDVTVIFTDLAGFSTISEKLSAEKLHDLLTEYFLEMMDILLEEHATLDKFIGDAIMVYFGCPIAEEDHALQACRSAVRMQRRVAELNKLWQQKGLPRLQMRVGINTGSVVAGNMGTESIFNYTIIGDSVNLASRLEGVNKEYGTSTIISEDTYRSVASGVTARELDCIRVKGKTEPVAIYELVSLKGETALDRQRTFDIYAEGLSLYRRRDWVKAVSKFQAILECDPADAPARTMLERSDHFRKDPPPDDWDGVFTMLHK